MKITNPITLDVARSNSYICLLAKQFDENSRFLIATLTNNGEPMIIPAGAAVTLRATRPDGEPVAVPGIINNDGTTTVEIDDYILEVVGSASLSIEVAIGDEILTSASFNLTIQRADGNGWLRVYVAAASLAAGNYYITIGDTPYAFTTTQAIPAGGSVYFASEGGTAQTRDASGNVLDASLTLTAGTSGTELTSDVPTMSFLAAIAGRMATIEAEMSQKANIDGSYPLLHAGTADNLMTDNGATQAIPFIQEGTGKGNGEATVKAGGVLQLKKKLGNTVAVNQLCDYSKLNTGTFSDIIVTKSGDTLIANGTASANAYINLFNPAKIATISGHKYLVVVPSGTAASYYDNSTTRQYNNLTAPFIFTGSGVDIAPAARISSGTTVTDLVISISLHDLTLWFGSNDRIPSDLLSHPENWGRYYAGSLDYNAGALESADGTVMRSIGRNVWDEQTEAGSISTITGANIAANDVSRSEHYLKVIPNSIYCIRKPTGYQFFGLFYDRDYNVVQYNAVAGTDATVFNSAAVFHTNATNNIFLVPANACYMRLRLDGVTTYNHDITISLYYSGESGYDQYYPHSIPAEVDTGSEVLRSAGSVADEKTPDGTITRRVGVVDLGSFPDTNYNPYEYSGNIDGFTFTGLTSVIKKASSASVVGNIQAAVFVNVSDSTFNSDGKDKEICVNTLGIIKVKYDGLTTASAIKAAMSGVYLYYELATPTTEQGTAFAENIPCDDFGSLMWTQTKGIPQGNEIFYPADLKGALDSIVAALPSANGTYTLHVTVTTAGVTFSWS